MCRVGRDETVDHGRHLQAPQDAQDQGQMRYGMTLLHGHWHTAPPVVASADQHHSGVPSHRIAGISPEQKSYSSTSPLERGVKRLTAPGTFRVTAPTAVYQQTVHRPRLRPTDRLWSGWHDVL